MQKKIVYRVMADWDSETRRWTVTSDDIPGLVLETNTVEEIVDCLQEFAPELIEQNCDSDGLDIPIVLQANYATRLLKSGHA